MQVQSFPPLIEAFLILGQPRQRLPHWTQALAALDDQRAPPLARVNGYHDPTSDQALLCVSYDELALGHDRLAYVVEVALLAEIGMIQPLELSEAERRRFLGERLARCTVTVAHQRSVVGALEELVRRIRDRESPQAYADTLPSIPGMRRPPLAPRVQLPLKRVLIPELSPAARAAREEAGRAKRAPGPSTERRLSRNVIPRGFAAPARTTTERLRDRASTAQMDPLEAQRLAALEQAAAEAAGTAEAGRERPRPSLGRGSDQLRPIDPYAPGTKPMPPGSIYARYLRSGRWVPIRVGALSLRGAALMAGALPRVHEQVEVALAYADFRALVRGPVHKISTREEAARRGATGFSVLFDLDDRSRRQLTALLHAARDAKVTIKPPPPRGNRRYPVEWPVCLDTAGGEIRAAALDVSREGMFVHNASPLAVDARPSFSAVLDDGGRPVSGRSRVVRCIDDAAARSCALAPGYGLRILEMEDADRERWDAFITRVERRAERRVLIGAATDRLVELHGKLAGAGYAVAGATDPDALMQLASRDERAVDACLIDAAWAPPRRNATWSETLFPSRTVPCVALRGDARRARETIDQVLSIE